MLGLLLDIILQNTTTLVIGVFVFILVTYLISNTKTHKCSTLPPGPKGVPLYGNLLEFSRSEKKGPGILDRWCAQYGDVYSLQFGPYPTVVLNSRDSIREAFLKNGDPTSGRPLNVFFFRYLVGKNGVLVNDGQEWKDMRRTALHSLRDFGMGKKSLESRIQEEAQALCVVIGQKESQVFDPHSLLHCAFSNVICSVIFGDRYEYDDSDFQMIANELVELFSNGGISNAELFVPILTPFIPLLNWSFFRGFRALVALRRYVKRKIREHEDSFDPDNITSFIDIYLKAKRTGELSCERQDDLMVCILDLFAAGSETSTTSLRWALLYLIHYPEVQTRCQQDIREVIGQARAPTNGDRPNLPYIEATIYEVQRIGSIVPYGVLHRVMEEVTVCGYTIPRDTLLISNLHHLHMETEYWGDPQTFRPERWLTDDGKQLIKHDNYLPFSTGPRECMGKSLAMQEMFIILVSLLQKFTFRAKDPDDLPKIAGKVAITNAPYDYELIAVKY